MNPYKILNIDHRATKREIIQAAALAMRERRFSVLEVAAAQRELLNPISKAAHDFLHFIDVKPLQEGLVPTRPDKRTVSDSPAPAGQELAALSRLSIFDGDP